MAFCLRGESSNVVVGLDKKAYYWNFLVNLMFLA